MKGFLISMGIIGLVGVGFFAESLMTEGAALKTSHSSWRSDATLPEISQGLKVAVDLDLPLSGILPTKNVQHTIDISEIKQGCQRSDCIPAITEPIFVNSTEASAFLSPQSLGIALAYKGVNRFYPFPVLETKEIVNDVVADDPLLITYCPLCGTGVVFSRVIDEAVTEFGVSGMLWQSNLLMYNRNENIERRNLWSQVLGEAVVGEKAGQQLTLIPSDIMRFSDWQALSSAGEVLTAETIRDPYQGRYYEVAQSFEPNFNEENSPMPPMEYVYGIQIEGVTKAYPKIKISIGETIDQVAGQKVVIDKTDSGLVTFSNEDGVIIPDVEGFWFSWVAAHPESLVF